MAVCRGRIKPLTVADRRRSEDRCKRHAKTVRSRQWSNTIEKNNAGIGKEAGNTCGARVFVRANRRAVCQKVVHCSIDDANEPNDIPLRDFDFKKAWAQAPQLLLRL